MPGSLFFVVNCPDVLYYSENCNSDRNNINIALGTCHTMLHAETDNELIYACKVLFAHQTGFDFDFIKALDPSGLKLAYRKKALETHPDRSKALGRTEEEMNSLFKEVSSAYKILAPFVAGKKAPYKLPKQSFSSPKPWPKKHSFKDRYYHGSMPERELKIGQFLYYSGRVSWKALIRAIVWQRNSVAPFLDESQWIGTSYLLLILIQF